jgi:hypothetical protein
LNAILVSADKSHCIVCLKMYDFLSTVFPSAPFSSLFLNFNQCNMCQVCSLDGGKEQLDAYQA